MLLFSVFITVMTVGKNYINDTRYSHTYSSEVLYAEGRKFRKQH
uniref:Transporter n=1 Tax=Heterorhabditis bacteriophora TaxID=37862 RepID=A0A1I7WZE1_HETBA